MHSGSTTMQHGDLVSLTTLPTAHAVHRYFLPAFAGSAWSPLLQPEGGSRSSLALHPTPQSPSSSASPALSSTLTAPSTLSACGRQL